MNLFIVRHGIAEERGKKRIPHDDRPLSARGIKKMRLCAEAMQLILPSSFTIITSPRQRAFATAEIIASQFSGDTAIVPEDALLPEGEMMGIGRMLKKYEKIPVIVMVGHEPNLGQFLASILGQKNPSVRVKKGSVIGVDYSTETPNRSILLFSIPPKILRMVGTRKK